MTEQSKLENGQQSNLKCNQPSGLEVLHHEHGRHSRHGFDLFRGSNLRTWLGHFDDSGTERKSTAEGTETKSIAAACFGENICQTERYAR